MTVTLTDLLADYVMTESLTGSIPSPFSMISIKLLNPYTHMSRICSGVDELVGKYRMESSEKVYHEEQPFLGPLLTICFGPVNIRPSARARS